MKLKQEERWLICKLTPDEIRRKGQELAVQCEKIVKAEEEETNRKKSAKDRIDALKNNRDNLASVVHAEEERRDIMVYTEIDGSEVTETRMDTGEIIQKRPATKDELQQRLSFEVTEALEPKSARATE